MREPEKWRHPLRITEREPHNLSVTLVDEPLLPNIKTLVACTCGLRRHYSQLLSFDDVVSDPNHIYVRHLDGRSRNFALASVDDILARYELAKTILPKWFRLGDIGTSSEWPFVSLMHDPDYVRRLALAIECRRCSDSAFRHRLSGCSLCACPNDLETCVTELREHYGRNPAPPLVLSRKPATLSDVRAACGRYHPFVRIAVRAWVQFKQLWR